MYIQFPIGCHDTLFTMTVTSPFLLDGPEEKNTPSICDSNLIGDLDMNTLFVSPNTHL